MNRTQVFTLLRRTALLAVLLGFAAVPVLMALQTGVARSSGIVC